MQTIPLAFIGLAGVVLMVGEATGQKKVVVAVR